MQQDTSPIKHPESTSRAPREREYNLRLVGTQTRGTDSWHLGKRTTRVAENTQRLPGFLFFDYTLANIGISLTEAASCDGQTDDDPVIFECWPHALPTVQSAILEIQWPGYEHYKVPFDFVRNGRPLFQSELLSQLAAFWRDFLKLAEKQSESIKTSKVPLDSWEAAFQHIRMLQLYSNDGLVWKTEAAYIWQD